MFLLVVPAQQSGLPVNVEFQMLTIRYKKNMAKETLPLLLDFTIKISIWLGDFHAIAMFDNQTAVDAATWTCRKRQGT